MSTIVVADIGGTNARFAYAKLSRGGVTVEEPLVLATGDFADLAAAFAAFRQQRPGPEIRGGAMALAGPVSQDKPFKLTNAHWTFDPSSLPRTLGLQRLVLLNDFAAIAHAVAGDAKGAHRVHLHGPAAPLPRDGRTVSIIGPGTGLGIAHYRIHQGRPMIQATEGAHIDFAPVCAIDDAILADLRQTYDRVSLERVVSGAGIAAIHSAIARLENLETGRGDPLAIWQAGIEGADPLARRAVAHFVRTLARAAGDYALAHGSAGVAVAGGIGQRLHAHCAQPEFHEAFCAKGRYRGMMEAIPIKLVNEDQPGLAGAAHAFAAGGAE